MDLPDQLPREIEPLLRALIRTLGPLAPHADADRILSTFGDVKVLGQASIGLEVVLPPAPAACDASLLLAPGSLPRGFGARDDLLRRLSQQAGTEHVGTVWWELDASSSAQGMGMFWRTDQDQPSFDRLQAAVADDLGLVKALATIRPWHDRWSGETAGLVGIFPQRTPAAAGMLLPIFPEHIDSALQRLSAFGATVSPNDPLVTHLRDTCTNFSLALGADALGRMSVSLEVAFSDREQAMLRGDWSTVLADPALWHCDQSVLDALLATQGQRRYDVFPPLTILTGIDHIKVGPGGRTKAYVGLLPLGASVLGDAP